MNAYTAIAVAMAAGFLVQAVAVRGYVWGLLSVAGWPAPLKILVSTLLWLAFSCIGIAPMFASLHMGVVLQEVQNSYLALGWLMLCFLLSFVPTAVFLRRKLPALRSAGYFRA